MNNVQKHEEKSGDAFIGIADYFLAKQNHKYYQDYSEQSFVRDRTSGYCGEFFVCRELEDVPLLDYYPPSLIMEEYRIVFRDWFDVQKDCYNYRKDDAFYLDFSVRNDYSFDIKKYIIEDLEFCHYVVDDIRRYNKKDTITFRSTVNPDYDKLPNKLYYYSHRQYGYYPEMTLWDSRHVKQYLQEQLANERPDFEDDWGKRYLFEIPYKYTEAVKLPVVNDDDCDGWYISYGGLDGTKARKIDSWEEIK